MAFDEVRFPENIDFGFEGGPEYSTDVLELFSGYEQRNQNWSLPRRRYVANHAIKTQAEASALIAFFMARKGKARGFRFRDWMDYSAINQNIGTGDGEATTFQLRKAYISGTTEYRACKKIVASGSEVGTVPKVYLESVLQAEGSDYTLDYNTGIITFADAPEEDVAITADFEFDVPVRFDTDAMKTRYEYGKEFYWDNISLVEIKL